MNPGEIFDKETWGWGGGEPMTGFLSKLEQTHEIKGIRVIRGSKKKEPNQGV